MKLTVKRVLIAVTAVALLIGVSSASAYESRIQKYFKSNPTTVKQLEMKWGDAVSVHVISEGLEKRIYGEKDAEIGYTYFIVKDGIVIDQGVTPSLYQKAKKATKPHLSRLMSVYYKKNNVTLKSRIKKYGKPLSTTTFPNGMKRVIFNYGDAQTGKKFFISHNGRILDAGMTQVSAKKSSDTTPKISKFMKKWFKKHPMSLKAITKKYGQPISTKVLKNGMTKMVFGPRDAVAGYKFFILQNGMAVDSGLTD
ncbi:MAG: hypothetical protein GY714_08460 [Desulfobacterales bacterium]|nr:hypothetical protein [Desulfobacterales bacterium]MCP4159632.1 hypothetical protein [Deltaproteobacteria bacterium]